MEYDFIVVGAGLTGLSCARKLLQDGLKGVVIEKSSNPGGRIRTEIVEGHRLDHGFQVLQTGYPEAASALDYTKLQLRRFPAGVVIRSGGKFHTIADPRRHPGHIFSTVFSPVGSVMDRIRMLRLAQSATSPAFEDLFIEQEMATSEYLQKLGFSEHFIESFFTPFFAGACLDREMSASSRVLRYILRVFAQGDAALPAQGMEQIPRQLAADIPEKCFHYNSRVISIDANNVTLDGGRTFSANHIIIATTQPELSSLVPSVTLQPSIGESCLYFSTDWKPPFDKPFLILNGEKGGPINNLAFPSLVSPDYAPPGKTLVAAVVLGDKNINATDLTERVRSQCIEWFGGSARKWSHLKTFTIHHALPDQQPPTANPYSQVHAANGGVWLAGEHNSLPGIQWALLSGRTTAEAILRTS